ncbi:MAG: hypothetical protein GC151_04205 [Betaproteobacteria bacterium]|nr:hypothetical protein [Betaproteobacteria bacterium]
MTPVGAGLAGTGWFTACGLPLETSDLSDARAYLDALGVHPSCRIEPVASWEHAERIIRNPSWDAAWWEREESERKRLMRVSVERLGEAAVLETLDLAVGAAHEIVHGAATLAAVRSGASDEALVRAAAGAAGMAAHGRVLAQLAGEGPSHVFVRKCALFEGGRWPLSFVGGAFHLF